MTIADIDTKVFDFIPLFEKRILSSEPSPVEMIGMAKIIDIGEVENLTLIRQDPTGSRISAYHDVDGLLIGLPEHDYSRFKELVSDFMLYPPFDEKASFLFVEEHSYDWLIEVYKSKKAGCSLSSYLLEKLEDEYKSFTFYFRLQPLSLEKPFSIGLCQICFLTPEFIEQEKSKLAKKGKAEDSQNGLFEHFDNSVIVRTTANGVFEKAKERAIFQAEASINVLQCFLHEYGIHNQFKLPELDHRRTNTTAASILHHYPSEESSLGYHIFNKHGVAVVELTEEMLAKLGVEEIGKFSKFLLHPQDTEYYYAVLESISAFSRISLTTDWYDKTVKLISFFEAILIDGVAKKGKGLTQLKILMEKLMVKEDIELGKSLAINFYDIRNVYVHNGEKKAIDHHRLYQFQTIAFKFLCFLIKNHQTFKSMDHFFAYLKT